MIHRSKTSVVTYQFAYVPGECDMCDKHSENPYPGTPALGAVSHGAHFGICESCAVEDMIAAAEIGAV